VKAGLPGCKFAFGEDSVFPIFDRDEVGRFCCYTFIYVELQMVGKSMAQLQGSLMQFLRETARILVGTVEGSLADLEIVANPSLLDTCQGTHRCFL